MRKLIDDTLGLVFTYGTSTYYTSDHVNQWGTEVEGLYGQDVDVPPITLKALKVAWEKYVDKHTERKEEGLFVDEV